MQVYIYGCRCNEPDLNSLEAHSNGLGQTLVVHNSKYNSQARKRHTELLKGLKITDSYPAVVEDTDVYLLKEKRWKH